MCLSIAPPSSSSSFGRGLLKVGDQFGSLLAPLDARKDHLGSWDVLLGVLQVLVQSLLTPYDT